MRSFSLVFALFLAIPVSSTALAQVCTTTSVGLTPLNDLGAGTYSGFVGGLYPGGSNGLPSTHDADAHAQSLLVVPRDASGTPDAATGSIVFLSIGMSNARLEWQEFMPLANADPMKDSHVLVVQGALGGKSADVINDPTDSYWPYVDGQVAAAGATNAQVQVVWLKEAHASPTDGFPTEAVRLQNDLTAILQILHTHFPNLRLAYLSSRIYAGYATSLLSPEPYAYQSGFGVKWTIEAQIAGSSALNWNPSAGAVTSPLLMWGPYTWADGTTPRSDGLVWNCSEYQSDGTHPNTLGSQKVANFLLDMCHTDTTATPWYIGVPVAPVDVFCTGDGLDAALLVHCPCNNFGAIGRGCANSVSAAGAGLVQSGTTNPDTIVLSASGMPLTTNSIFLKANAADTGGVVFGDGIRCLTGDLIRMALKTNQNGASSYPGPSNQPVSVRGGTQPGSGAIGYYSTYYRNAANYCTSATFNITNAVRIVW